MREEIRGKLISGKVGSNYANDSIVVHLTVEIPKLLHLNYLEHDAVDAIRAYTDFFNKMALGSEIIIGRETTSPKPEKPVITESKLKPANWGDW